MRSSIARIVPLETQVPRIQVDDTAWPLLICLLGSFRLLQTGRPISLGNAGKTEALLGYLALHTGRRISRETLIQAIWPDHDPTLAGQSLNSLVYSLRKRFGEALSGEPPIIHADGVYWLNTEAGVGVDVVYFDQLVTQGDQQTQAGHHAAAMTTYRRALAVYRGDLDTGSDLHATVERERLRVKCLGLLGRLADYHFRQADYTTCLDYAWRLLARDPCREDAHRLAMQCHVRLGQRSQALRQYRLCQDLLHTEFDTSPEPATTALFDLVRHTPDRV